MPKTNKRKKTKTTTTNNAKSKKETKKNEDKERKVNAKDKPGSRMNLERPARASGPATPASIPTKDHKLLWGRAAGRCSMEDCRARLSDDVPETTASITLGAMCHIVGEKPSAARGKSPLSLKERNSYANLVLMCSHHHDVIDRNPKKYPVEILHGMKTKHELWVEANLGGRQDAASLVYADVVDEISEALSLEHWAIFSDLAVRGLLATRSAHAAEGFEVRLQSIEWPGKHVDLDEAARTVMNSFCRYVTHFETFCESRGDGLLTCDRSYKRIYPNPAHHESAEKERLWERLGLCYLCALALDLNDFCGAVRKHINPVFFVTTGRFLIHDSLQECGLGPAFLLTREQVDEGIAQYEPDWKAKLSN